MLAVVPGESVPNTEELFIGRDAAGGSFFAGAIDELEIFRRALGLSELASIFNADVSGKCRCVDAW